MHRGLASLIISNCSIIIGADMAIQTMLARAVKSGALWKYLNVYKFWGSPSQ